MTASNASSAAILKHKYTQPKVFWESYDDNPSFAEVRKDATFDGDLKIIAVQTEAPIGGGFSVGQAIANMGPGTYKNFQLTRIEDFGVARIKGQALKSAEKSTGALLDLWTREMDGIILHVTRSASINMWRTGTGSRGYISAGSTTGSTTITLGVIQDISNFYVGMQLQASATDGGLLRGGGTFAIASKVNRVTGTLTSANTFSSQIAGLSTGDYLYRNGDAANAGTNLMVSGVQGWVVPLASRPVTTATWFGLDRTSDEVRLAGLYLDGTNTAMQEVLIEAIAQIEVEGGKVDRIWMHPRDRANFAKELGAKVEYKKDVVRIPGSTASVGFKAMEVTLGDADVLVMADINVPRYTCLVTQWDTWAFESLGPAPHILDFDSNQFLRVQGDDSYEVRVGYYANLSNAAPAYSSLVSNFGL